MAKLYLVNERDGRSLDLDAIAISESCTGLRRFPICTDSSLENSQTMRCYRLPRAIFRRREFCSITGGTRATWFGSANRRSALSVTRNQAGDLYSACCNSSMFAAFRQTIRPTSWKEPSGRSFIGLVFQDCRRRRNSASATAPPRVSAPSFRRMR